MAKHLLITSNLKSCDQLIKTMTKFEKEIRHWVYVLTKKTTTTMINSMKCQTTVLAHDAFCLLTQA